MFNPDNITIFLFGALTAIALMVPFVQLDRFFKLKKNINVINASIHTKEKVLPDNKIKFLKISDFKPIAGIGFDANKQFAAFLLDNEESNPPALYLQAGMLLYSESDVGNLIGENNKLKAECVLIKNNLQKITKVIGKV